MTESKHAEVATVYGVDQLGAAVHAPIGEGPQRRVRAADHQHPFGGNRRQAVGPGFGTHRVAPADAHPRRGHRQALLVGKDRRVAVRRAGEAGFHQAVTGGRRDAHGWAASS